MVFNWRKEYKNESHERQLDLTRWRIARTVNSADVQNAAEMKKLKELHELLKKQISLEREVEKLANDKSSEFEYSHKLGVLDKTRKKAAAIVGEPIDSTTGMRWRYTEKLNEFLEKCRKSDADELPGGLAPETDKDGDDNSSRVETEEDFHIAVPTPAVEPQKRTRCEDSEVEAALADVATEVKKQIERLKQMEKGMLEQDNPSAESWLALYRMRKRLKKNV